MADVSDVSGFITHTEKTHYRFYAP